MIVSQLHNNKLTALPDSFADLTALTVVDLSHNQLTSLPTNSPLSTRKLKGVPGWGEVFMS